MRPPRSAAENAAPGSGAHAGKYASMRPPRSAAENGCPGYGGPGTWRGFNEAAAFCGGKLAVEVMLVAPDASFNEAAAFCGGKLASNELRAGLFIQLQ